MKHANLRSIPRLPCLLIALLVSTTQAFGTWSIVAIDRATGEVGIAAATCLGNFHLRRWIAVVRVGEGVAAAQASVSGDIGNRFTIWSGLQAGSTPQEILAALAAADSQHQTRQYGIAGFSGPPATFTGTVTSAANLGVTGRVGDLEYAIQGNVLAGDEVVHAAEQAFVETQGDMGQRLMAGMEAARAWGGDGRCSCDEFAPATCGAPPPGFTQSAHTAFVLVARMGDDMGVCTSNNGCANGTYYLWRKEIGGEADPDPIPILQRRYDDWRQSLAGIPDHTLTEVLPGAQRLMADGVTSTVVTVRLRDVDGIPLDHGGQTLALTQTNAGPPVALVGPVTDHGDGTHTFTLTATAEVGSGSWRIVVEQGSASVQLHPELMLVVDPVADLHVGYDTVSAAAAPDVPFVLNLGAAEAGRPYQVLGSASGTSPGTPWSGGLVLPLNWDRLLFFTLGSPGSRFFPDSAGTLDPAGRAEPTLDFPSVAFAPFIGGHFDFCGVLAGSPDQFTAVTGFDVAP